MKNEINAVLENMTTTTPEPEDYTGEDGLLYCGKCRKPKEAYFAPDKAAVFGRDRHPAECDCQRAAREEREAAEKRRRHLDTVEELKRRGFTDPTMRDWTFENDNGRNPQTGIARRYVEHWEDMRTDNIGCLFWGGVGTGKSYLAGCIANALMEKEIPVHMTNFALILNDLAASFEGRNEYISRLCRYPLLILDDFGMERGTEYGLEQVFHVIDSRYRSGKPLIVTTNLTLDGLHNPEDTAHSEMFPSRFLLQLIRKGVTEMAATRLIALHANKGKTIARSLSERTDYAKNPDKTEKGELVTGYQCDPFTVDEEFMLTKRKYEQITGRHQRRDVIAYQIRQSFKPGEITPEEANRLGRELALRFTKGKFAFIVATHTDRAHIHNHIVFNSTSLDGTKKFKNFWFSGLALQRLSDLVCLENSLSVIEAKPIGEREKRTEYPTRTSIRDIICRDIDRILQKRPKDLETVLFQLQQLGYEIKRGKHVSVKGRNQKRFVRLSSLPEGYREAEIRSAISGEAKREGRPRPRPERSFNLLIDIQSKMQSKGKGFKRWATVYNLKQMSKTLLFLRDNKIDSVDLLNALTTEKQEKRGRLLCAIQESEKRLAEIATLKTQIINYSKTRPIYEVYRKAGYSKRFLEEHRKEIMLHKAAKAAFDALGIKKLPKVKELSLEYEQVLEAKKAAYAEYRQVKKETQEYWIAQRNIASLYAEEREDDEERQRREEKKQR